MLSDQSMKFRIYRFYNFPSIEYFRFQVDDLYMLCNN